MEEHATTKELQSSYRRQAIKVHPDRNTAPDAVARFHLLTLALNTLTDPEQRREYDAARKQKREVERRRELVERERRTWIDELEKGERLATGNTDETRRRKWQEANLEEELAREGAQLRAELRKSQFESKNLRTSQTQLSKETLPTQHLPRQPHPSDTKDSTIKIRFKDSNRTERDIRETFRRFGTIQEIIYRPSEKRTQSALIEFANRDAARSAMAAKLDHAVGLGLREVKWAYDSPGRSVPKHKEEAGEATVSSDPPASASQPESSFSFKRPKLPETTGPPKITNAYQESVLHRMRMRQREKEAMASVK